MYLLVAVCALLIPSSQNARILGIVGSPSISHQAPFQPLWRELSLRGHRVTVITSDPLKDPALVNLTEFDMRDLYGIVEKINVADMSNVSFVAFLDFMVDFQVEVQGALFENPEIQNFIADASQEFDVVLLEPLLPALFAFAERFECPLIQIFSFDGMTYNYHLIGNPAHPVTNPDIMLPFVGELTFSERLGSVLYNLYYEKYIMARMNSKSELQIEKYFGQGYAPIEDIARKTSMLFVNSNPILHPIRPLLPSVVQFGGGAHLKPLKPLPKDLQTILDNAKQGFIYFSLGSNVKSKELPDEKRNIMLKVFSELPYVVLWKFELDDLPNKPKNVVISKWFPQQDVLRHPNIKLFITQGGLQSTEETVYSGVPIVGIPFMGDQQTNVKRMVHKGIGLGLEYKSLTERSFREAIVEVIDNPKYRAKVKQLADLVQDLPMKGIDNAVWWTEYVIRHKGAQHLKSPALDLPFYQYYLLDVIAFCLFVLFIALYIPFVLLRLTFRLFRYLFRGSKTKTD